MRKTFLALRNRNFRLFFVGQLISNTGNWLTNVALTLLVLKITGSGLGVGILAGFQFGPILLLSAWAGAIADRSDKRRLLLVTQSLEMAQSVGLAALAFMPRPPLAGLYALAAVGGICSPSTTRCGARSSPRWSGPRTFPTRWSSTAPSSTSRACSGRPWPASWW